MTKIGLLALYFAVLAYATASTGKNYFFVLGLSFNVAHETTWL